MHIEINYENLDKLSNSIINNADEVKRILNSLYSNINELKDYWIGPDASSYINEILNYQRYFNNLEKFIREYGLLLKDVNINYQNLENTTKEVIDKI